VPIKFNSPNDGFFSELAHPYVGAGNKPYLTDDILAKIKEFSVARTDRLMKAENLLRVKDALSRFRSTRAAANDMAEIITKYDIIRGKFLNGGPGRTAKLTDGNGGRVRHGPYWHR